MIEYNFDSDVVIGLEIHVELNTKSKLFCGCKREGSDGEEPNTRVCPVCLGQPGSKPVLNKEALTMSMKLALALECTLAPELVFSRKSYFYPDLAKNYQISQFELPLGEGGVLKLSSGKKIGITRVHMEEDPASLVHPAGMRESGYVLVDYNRSGDPLCEVVSEPDMRSPEEARDFMKELITVLDYLEVFDVDTCIIKADANISIKESGYIRAEIKNVTGFKEIERALNYELQRQKHDVAEGKKLILETRGWDADKGITYSMRTKETSEDYGYIIDPDLVKIEITKEMVDGVRSDMPELAQDKLEKFKTKHNIADDTAKVLAKDKELAFVFEKVSAEVDSGLASKWIRRELSRVLNYAKKKLSEVELNETHLIDLLKLVEQKKITDNVAQKILEELVKKPFDVNEYVKKEGLEAVSDSSELEKFVKEAMDENPKAVEDIKAGNEKSINFILGQVMRKSRGKASPKEVHDIIKTLI